MEALLQELEEKISVKEIKKKLGKLIKRVDLFNVTGSAAEIGTTVKNAANTLQSLKDDYCKEEEPANDEGVVSNIRKFNAEFSEALKNECIENVVVMIDDLDRCRPERIIEVLEVIKLFLAVERTTFIIAANENVIKYSIRGKYPPMNGFDIELDKEYIEKIIQLPVYIPELPVKDIQDYLLLLVA